MQARSHGSAGMWGVGGDKSCEPSQGERGGMRREERGVCERGEERRREGKGGGDGNRQSSKSVNGAGGRGERQKHNTINSPESKAE